MASVPKMTSPAPENSKYLLRLLQYGDLETLEMLTSKANDADNNCCSVSFLYQIKQIQRWYGLLKFLSWFPNPYQYSFCIYVVEHMQQVIGGIKVIPFNRTRSTWRVEQVLIDTQASTGGAAPATLDIGSGLLRYCFETIWEARTWLLEVNVHDQTTMAVCRQNGFQPLAHMTYWSLDAEILAKLAQREPDLPNLLPVSNADAQLLYQLDTASMPPLVRQVFDRHIYDFKRGFLTGLVENLTQWLNQTEVVSAYVFEPQRKAAIGYFRMQLYRKGQQTHEAELTVHPAYTCLYPELMSQMARIVQHLPGQSLKLVSADYQPEREEYLEQLGAKRIEHTLLMSRSVWHKLREARPVSFELSDVLQGLKPVRTPIPSRITFLPSQSLNPRIARSDKSQRNSSSPSSLTKNGKLPSDAPKTDNQPPN